MAINLEKLIDLDLLSYYDENLKKWIASTTGSNSTKFVTGDENLPEKGEVGVLYITKDTIKYWDGEEYVDVGAGSGGESNSWGTF